MKNIREKAPCYGRVAVMIAAVVVLALLTTCRAPETEPAPPPMLTPEPEPASIEYLVP